MKPIDFAKAAGIAALVLGIDVLFAIGVVFAWSILFEPGHPRAYYETQGIPIARWSRRPWRRSSHAAPGECTGIAASRM